MILAISSWESFYLLRFFAHYYFKSLVAKSFMELNYFLFAALNVLSRLTNLVVIFADFFSTPVLQSFVNLFNELGDSWIEVVRAPENKQLHDNIKGSGLVYH